MLSLSNKLAKLKYLVSIHMTRIYLHTFLLSNRKKIRNTIHWSSSLSGLISVHTFCNDSHSFKIENLHSCNMSYILHDNGCIVYEKNIPYCELGPSINGLVTNGNLKLCCRAFILVLFHSTTANKFDSEHIPNYKKLLQVCEVEILQVTVKKMKFSHL